MLLKIELQKKKAIKLVQKEQYNCLHLNYYKAVMSARIVSCRLILASSTLLSSSHLENLIIYTSAPLDAVPI